MSFGDAVLPIQVEDDFRAAFGSLDTQDTLSAFLTHLRDPAAVGCPNSVADHYATLLPQVTNEMVGVPVTWLVAPQFRARSLGAHFSVCFHKVLDLMPTVQLKSVAKSMGFQPVYPRVYLRCVGVVCRRQPCGHGWHVHCRMLLARRWEFLRKDDALILVWAYGCCRGLGRVSDVCSQGETVARMSDEDVVGACAARGITGLRSANDVPPEALTRLRSNLHMWATLSAADNICIGVVVLSKLFKPEHAPGPAFGWHSKQPST